MNVSQEHVNAMIRESVARVGAQEKLKRAFFEREHDERSRREYMERLHALNEMMHAKYTNRIGK